MVDSKHDSRRSYLQCELQVPTERENEYIDVMNKYGANHWWNSTNPAVICSYQMNESLLLVPFIKLQNALEVVLKRNVSSKEISYNNDALRAEVNAATA